jgi:hypothetical protein
MLLPVTVPVPTRPFFGVIIGAGNYRHLPKLSGCVADAHLIADSFVKNLGVSRTNLSILCDENATRSNIIDSIRSLAHNEAIRKGDPIIIYYAGWASRVKSPTAWGIDERMSLLHPYDSLQDDHMTSISDRTLYQLLSEIALRKGNNIVRPSRPFVP